MTHGVLQRECGGDSEGSGGGAEDGVAQEGGDGGVHGRGHRVEGHRGHHARVSHLWVSAVIGHVVGLREAGSKSVGLSIHINFLLTKSDSGGSYYVYLLYVD